MIRIVKGTFGYFDGRRVVPVTFADGPQNYDPELEARLVSEGVAEYVGEAPAAEPAPDPEPTPVPEPEQEADEADGEPALEDMTRAELADIAEGYGIKAGKLTKAKLIEAIEGAEKVPDLSAAAVE